MSLEDAKPVRQIDRHVCQPHLPLLTLADLQEGIKLMSPRYYGGLIPGLIKGSPQYIYHHRFRRVARVVVQDFIGRMVSQPK